MEPYPWVWTSNHNCWEKIMPDRLFFSWILYLFQDRTCMDIDVSFLVFMLSHTRWWVVSARLLFEWCPGSDSCWSLVAESHSPRAVCFPPLFFLSFAGVKVTKNQKRWDLVTACREELKIQHFRLFQWPAIRLSGILVLFCLVFKKNLLPLSDWGWSHSAWL